MRPNALLTMMLVAALLAGGCEDKKPRKPASGGGPAAASAGNAADDYEALWGRLPEELNMGAAALSLDEDGRPRVTSLTGAPGEVADWEGLERLLVRHRDVIAALQEATEGSRCEFGLKLTATQTAESDRALATCGSFRKSARILNADAVRAWLAGDGDTAAERLAAMYRLSGHVAQQGLVLTSLVSAALIQLTDATARAMAASGTPLSAEQRGRVLAALNALDATDPSGLRGARQKEGDPDAANGQAMDTVHARLTRDIAQTRRVLKGE